MPEHTLSALIGEIYDAALDPGLWEPALEKTSDFVGGCTASVYSKDPVSMTADIMHVFGVGDADSLRERYASEYIEMDPTTPGLSQFGVGDVVDIADIIPYDEFLETRFYKEWSRSQGWIDMVTLVLDKSATGYSVASVFRHDCDGRTDDNARERMRLLAPHLQRAIVIGKAIELNRSETASLANVLDSLAAGVFFVDARGALVQTNACGQAILADKSALRTGGGKLIASDPNLDQTLRQIFADAGKGIAELGGQGISVPLVAADGERYIVHVLPLADRTRRQVGVSNSAVAAVFLRRAQIATSPVPDLIARLYNLTPSELRVLLAVFELSGVADVAETLGISQATAKTHLQRLFDKTGARRQIDLVKLVAGFAAPRL